ncbi:MAG: phosphatidylserine decarboxylase family protein [Calditrichales bacterium]|nr:MAG: phosphatidylserine decarboxylase family protein [Calditrichales bacterium]
MIAPDGFKLIIYTAIAFVLLVLATYFYPVLILKILSVLLGIVFVFNFYFFRDPERTIPSDPDLILSPADGTVVLIEDVDEPYYFKQKVRRVSIFLSVFNVHVNRIPVAGKVEFLKYIKGKFLVAFADKASEENEQSAIGIRHEKGKILFKQIAGIIARRIVFHLEEGQAVNAGDRFGLIRYGSRVDMFFPDNVEINVKLQDKVVGGETIIGKFKE